MARKRKSRSDVAPGLPVEGSTAVPHHDLRVQLQAVEPRSQYDPGLRAGADGGYQESPDHEAGRKHCVTFLLVASVGSFCD
jgi:hypothetical protein